MNIEEVLTGLKIPYTVKGLDFLISCVNPEHNDSNPSMRVDRLTGVYHCFSCGTKGSLLREHGYAPSILDNRIQKIKEGIDRLLAKELVLPEGAMPFIHKHRGISAETYSKFGAFVHDTYEGRIVFPITNLLGKIYAFQGRHTHSSANPKYKVYPRHVRLGLFPARPEIYKSSVILVEGMFDMLNLYEHGIKNAVACFGTSTMFSNIGETLEPYYILGVTKIYIMFDGDNAGEASANKLVRAIPEKYNAEIITLPKDTDPGDLSKSMVAEIKRGVYAQNSNSREDY